MEITKIVEGYLAKNESSVEVNLEALVLNDDFRSEAVKGVKAFVKNKQQSCVLLPAYTPGATKNRLGQFINELAKELVKETLVVGQVENIDELRQKPKEVIIIKQSFRTGKELKGQVDKLKAMGVKVSVLCFITHSTDKLKGFAYENNIEMDALVKTDEIRYIK